MSNKEANRKIVDLYLTQEYWKPEHSDIFAEDIVVDLPSAPPGMPQHLDECDYRMYRSWLCRTVSNYTSVVKEAYGTPNPDQFWAVRTVECDTTWGKDRKPRKFKSMIFSRIEFKDGKLAYIKNCWNPLAFLYAIDADVPTFKMDMYDPRIDEYMKNNPLPEEADNAAELDMSPEAIRQRVENNLKAFCHPNFAEAMATLACYVPHHESHVWFLPPEMREEYPREMMERVEAWTTLSCPDIGFDPCGVSYPTDDPHIYFCEYALQGDVDWVGNNAPGAHYRNRYFYILRFDDAGRIAVSEEILNPINKFNSIGVSVPSFPYFF